MELQACDRNAQRPQSRRGRPAAGEPRPLQARPEAKPARPRDDTRAAILTGPVLPTLLRLALPTMVVLLAQTAVNIAEAYYVGFLGTDALAGVAMVFPVFMLMTMMSNGGIGSGVASSVARAVGAGRKQDADALLFHAMVIAVIFGAAFTLGTIRGGPMLYRALGGHSQALNADFAIFQLSLCRCYPGMDRQFAGRRFARVR